MLISGIACAHMHHNDYHITVGGYVVEIKYHKKLYESSMPGAYNFLNPPLQIRILLKSYF